MSKKYCVKIDVEAENKEDAVKKADEKITEAMKVDSTIGNISEIEEDVPTIDSWKIVLITDKEDVVEFDADSIPAFLQKKIDDCIENAGYPVSWVAE